MINIAFLDGTNNDTNDIGLSQSTLVVTLLLLFPPNDLFGGGNNNGSGVNADANDDANNNDDDRISWLKLTFEFNVPFHNKDDVVGANKILSSFGFVPSDWGNISVGLS